MGCCFSCKLTRRNKDKQPINLTKDEMKILLIELTKNYQFSTIYSLNNKSNNQILDQNQLGNDISDENKSILMEFLDYEIKDSETSSIYGNVTYIPRTLTHTYESENISINKKLLESSQSYKSNEKICQKVSNNGNYFSDLSHNDNKPTFLDNPLTADEVKQVFKKNQNLGVSIVSLKSTDSQILIDNNNDNIERVDFNDFSKEKNEIEFLTTNENVEIFNPDFESTKLYEENIESLRSEINLMINNEHFQNSNGQILNSVPKAYKKFKSYMQIERKNSKHYKESKKKIKIDSHKLFHYLYNLNYYNQNILHQLVLSKNSKEIVPVVNCLVHLESLHLVLNAVDYLNNTPIAYSIMTGNSETTKILLSYHPVIPQLCYFKTIDNFIPIFHVAYQSSIKNNEDNLVTLIGNHLFLKNEKEKLRELLEIKDNGGLSILHYVIINFIPTFHENKNIALSSEFYINFLHKIGSNFQLKFKCPYKENIFVDALGQAIFSKYPFEIVKILTEIPSLKDLKFQFEYIIDNISYELEELFQLRVDISMETKKSVLRLLQSFK